MWQESRICFLFQFIQAIRTQVFTGETTSETIANHAQFTSAPSRFRLCALHPLYRAPNLRLAADCCDFNELRNSLSITASADSYTMLNFPKWISFKFFRLKAAIPIELTSKTWSWMILWRGETTIILAQPAPPCLSAFHLQHQHQQLKNSQSFTKSCRKNRHY